MQHTVSSIWQRRLPSDIVARTERCVAAGCEQKSQRGEALVFFRADDIAAPGNQFSRLLKLFAQYRVPLCLAVVPAWITKPRWLALNYLAQPAAFSWCWHQHGWRHINHEVEGKKQEFGPSRSRADLEHDIRRGRQRLENLMGRDFYPVFTPPWNRCDDKTLDVLKDLGFAGISRSRGVGERLPTELPSFDINVDLHTRKEGTPVRGWHNLFVELQQALASGCCGIMIHHQRMNPFAFDFLEVLIRTLAGRKDLKLVDFRGL